MTWFPTFDERRSAPEEYEWIAHSSPVCGMFQVSEFCAYHYEYYCITTCFMVINRWLGRMLWSRWSEPLRRSNNSLRLEETCWARVPPAACTCCGWLHSDLSTGWVECYQMMFRPSYTKSCRSCLLHFKVVSYIPICSLTRKMSANAPIKICELEGFYAQLLQGKCPLSLAVELQTHGFHLDFAKWSMHYTNGEFLVAFFSSISS